MREADIAALTPGDLPPHFSTTSFPHRLFLTAVITDVCNPAVPLPFRLCSGQWVRNTCPSRAGQMGAWSGREVDFKSRGWDADVEMCCAENRKVPIARGSLWRLLKPSAGTACLQITCPQFQRVLSRFYLWCSSPCWAVLGGRGCFKIKANVLVQHAQGRPLVQPPVPSHCSPKMENGIPLWFPIVSVSPNCLWSDPAEWCTREILGGKFAIIESFMLEWVACHLFCNLYTTNHLDSGKLGWIGFPMGMSGYISKAVSFWDSLALVIRHFTFSLYFSWPVFLKASRDLRETQQENLSADFTLRFEWFAMLDVSSCVLQLPSRDMLAGLPHITRKIRFLSYIIWNQTS